MTSRQVYEAVLIELRKENAPNILLEHFNYLINKAVNQYINKRYNIYDINQQTTDDLRVLKATALLTPSQVTEYQGLTLANGATYSVILPPYYLHMLNCICIYDVKKTFKCYNQGDTWRAPATRLTADAYSQVLDNFWNKPTYLKPYYYIHNVNISTDNPTNPNDNNTQLKGFTSSSGDLSTLYEQYQDNGEIKYRPITLQSGTDISSVTATVGDTDGNGNSILKATNGLPKSITVGGRSGSLVEKSAEVRYGNVSQVRCEIRYGTDNSVFSLKYVYIDYIKAPQYIRLTQEQLDWTEDKSQMLEFPDYVCQEIINELVHIVMENISDQRLQTHPVVSQSIANPAQQQTEPVAQQQAAQ